MERRGRRRMQDKDSDMESDEEREVDEYKSSTI